MSSKNILRFIARTVVIKQQPIIIGVVGSDASLVKEAIFLILSKNYFVQKSEYDNANATNILLTIIGVSSFSAAFFRWIGIIVFHWRYPDVLVLDMNMEDSEDMKRLINLVPVNAGVVTRISPEYKEQGKLITFLAENSFAVFNNDDQLAVKIGEKTKAKIITYGFSEGAALLADNVVFHQGGEGGEKGEERGFSFKLNYGGNTIPVRLPQIADPQHIEPVLAAVAVCIALKMNLVEIVSVLES